ncbi:hypothetical protein FPZ43_00240 [Mucilaginibacter pallidiroseus]|uniref:Lipoprotein n=1 Tax=Mucilaginibacter pallidiroseus TaxID=2599295 RepID=A0A563UHV1_9SPHI|nr:hypothetical protein [Mucilaginibacter pallidiroseus]TWR30947.1 hypothetical protein FPZ43_00240 [Mucilaginibacter pallidiroseus]
MKTLSISTFIIFAAMLTGCVQKSRTVTVNLKLYVTGIKNIKQVGVRGEGNPLSSDKDLVMQPVIKDSIYTVSFNTVTGYNFLECKFAIDDKVELKGQPNRRIDFVDKDTMSYEAKYQVPGKIN